MVMSDFINSLNRNKQKIQNYIFQGGSVKGLAYIGALEELERNGIKVEKIKRMGGTSVGAITATLLSIGYDLNELNKELKELDFKEFIDIEDKELREFVFEKFLNSSDIKVAIQSEYTKKKDIYHDFKKEHQITFGENFDQIKPISIIATYLKRFPGLFKAVNEVKTGFALVKKLMNNKGLAEGKVIRDWMEEKIFIKTGFKNATFAELDRLHEKKTSKIQTIVFDRWKCKSMQIGSFYA